MKLVLFLATISAFTVNSFSYSISSLKELNGNEKRITEIDLSNQGITEFPKEILKCTNLKSLNLSNNGFVKIPYQLGKLEQLERLDLSDNQNISPLDLSLLFDSCRFELRELDLSDCALFFFPTAAASQTKIKRLDISDNFIQVLPFKMSGMTQMTFADFSNNRIRNMSWLSTKWWSLKELDVSGNKGLESEGLLINVSYLDNLQRVVISDLDMIPQQFEYFTGKEIVFKNCTLESIPRNEETAGLLSNITFENCVFSDVNNIIRQLNVIQPSKIVFRDMDSGRLAPFLALNVDSLDVRENEIKNIDPVVKMERLKWLDLRGNEVTPASIDFVAKRRPDIEMTLTEPIQASMGISRPIPGMEPKPEVVKITTEKKQIVVIGKTIFNIPKDAFLTPEGKVYSGDVRIEYTEYNTPEAIFLSGIPMTADVNGEPIMLSSGGMFNFEAKDENGNNLQANPDQLINAQLISSNNIPEMQVWKLDESGSWQSTADTDSMTEIFKINPGKLDSIMMVDFGERLTNEIEYYSNRYVPKVKKGDRLSDFEIAFDIYPTYWQGKNLNFNGKNIDIFHSNYHSDYIAGLSLIYDGDSSEYHRQALEAMTYYCKKSYKRMREKGLTYRAYSKEGPNYVSELRLAPDYDNDNMDLIFTFKDSLVNIPVEFKTSSRQHDRRPKEITTLFGRYQYQYKKFVKEKRRNFLRVRPILQKSERLLKERALQAEISRQRRLYDQKYGYPMTVNLGSVSRQIELRGFGIWNCDAIKRMEAPAVMARNYLDQNGREIKGKVKQVTIIDKTNNGVISYSADEKAYYDKNSDNVILIVFKKGNIGVYKSGVNEMRTSFMEVELVDPENEENKLKALIRS